MIAPKRNGKRKAVFAYRSWGRVDDAHAGRWGVVHSLPFLAKGVPDVVQVLLLELVLRHAAFGKLCPPESQGRIQREPNALVQFKHCGQH